MKKGVELITNPERAKVLVDPMRREVVRLLSERPMTENELAKALGLSDPSVGHHLKILKRSGLIRIARRQVEKHGILQKFYEANALVCFVYGPKIPLEIERYFMPVNLERARGIVAGLSALDPGLGRVSAKELEEFSRILTLTIVQTASRYSKPCKLDREELISEIYRDALTRLLKRPQLLPDTIKGLFSRAREFLESK